MAEPLAERIAARAPRVTPLTPGVPITGMPRNLRWRLAVNDQVEADDELLVLGRGHGPCLPQVQAQGRDTVRLEWNRR